MVWFLGALARHSVVGLMCPHCSEAQASARANTGAAVRCRKCGKDFARAEGVRGYREARKVAVAAGGRR